MLNQRKAWSEKEDQLLSQIYTKNKTQIQLHSLNWNHIADLFNSLQSGLKRTGKQCRQRWYNQLNPEIRKSNFWTLQEKTTIVQLHNSYGNKWSIIAKMLVGRTDNSVKNFINSTLRKGLRLLNLYLSKNKKFGNFPFRNLKEYKTDLLTKILLFSGEKETFHEQEYSISLHNKQQNQNETLKIVYQLAKTIKSELLFLEDTYLSKNLNFVNKKTYESIQEFQSIIKNIQKLNTLCKKKKQKKISTKNLPLQCQNQSDQNESMLNYFTSQNDIYSTDSNCQKTSTNSSRHIIVQDYQILSFKNPRKAQTPNILQKVQKQSINLKSNLSNKKTLQVFPKDKKISKKSQKQTPKNHYKKPSDLISNQKNQTQILTFVQKIQYDFSEATPHPVPQKSVFPQDMACCDSYLQNCNNSQGCLTSKKDAKDFVLSKFFIPEEPNLFIEAPGSPHPPQMSCGNFMNSEDDYFCFNQMGESNMQLYPMQMDIDQQGNKFVSQYADFNFYQMNDVQDFV